MRTVPWAVTDNPEAYRYYVRGLRYFYKGDWKAVIESLTRAFEIDTSAYTIYGFLIGAYSNDGKPKEARQVLDLVYQHRDRVPYSSQVFIDFWKAKFDKNPNEYLKNLKIILDMDPEQRSLWYQLGLEYIRLDQYEKSIASFEKVLELDKQRGVPWEWSSTYRYLGKAYHEVGNHKRENEVYELGLSIFPENYRIIERQAICAVSQGDTIRGDELLERYISLYNETNTALSAHSIKNRIGLIYSSANDLEKAEQLYRQAHKIKSDYTPALNNLAANLFDQDKNLNEGMDLINKALEIYPESALYLWTKGEGLSKLGKYDEALELYDKAWDLYYFYNHDLYLDIQEVKQAIARQNRKQ